MLRLPVPPVHDIARIVLGDTRDVQRELVGYYELGVGSFNYMPARTIGTTFLKGGLKPEVAVSSCYKIGSPSGRELNAQVVKLLCGWARGRMFSFYEVATGHLRIGPNLSVRVPIEGYLVEHGVPSFLWMQPRKTFNPNHEQLSLIATCIKHVYGVDDYEAVGLQILDFSALEDGGDRVLEAYRYDDLELLSRTELSRLLTEFAEAYRALVESGFRKPVRPTKEKRPDERQRELL